jgi:MFS family permease
MAVHVLAVGALLPLLVADLGINYTQGGILIGLFMLPGIVLALPGGYLGLWIGDRRLTLIGLALMTAGGVVFGLSHGFALAATGRLLSGMGSAFLNVILYKMAADWFSGRELSTATGLVATSWPVGMALALATLGGLGLRWGWQAAALSVSAVSLLALLAVARWYRSPPSTGAAAQAATSWRAAIGLGEALLASSAGLVRMFVAVGQSVFIGFAPAFLVARGSGIVQAGFLVSTVSWVMIASTILGGLLADRSRRPLAVILAGSAGLAALLLAVPGASALVPLFLAIGVVGGLPAGPVNALPGAVLRPQSRAIGFGIFFTFTYLGQTFLPALAGWMLDHTGDPAASVYFASALNALALPALLLLVWVRRRVSRFG